MNLAQRVILILAGATLGIAAMWVVYLLLEIIRDNG